jgi:DNA-binding winged helix-turn-helix (wHTH) protein/tetratricopeptide (TPR) repeat protein
LYRFADCTLDIERRELRRGGVLIALEPQVFDLLRYLVEQRAHVVSRDEVLQAVWKGRIVSDSVLSTRLNAVRVAIGDSGREQQLIRTLPKQGVRFVGKVNEENEASMPADRRLAFRVIDTPGIAVLPFASLGNNPQANLIGEILREEIVTALWQHNWLAVMTAEPAGFGTAPTRYRLHGSLRSLDRRVRVLIRLIEAESGCCLWTKTYDIEEIDRAAADGAAEAGLQIADIVFAAETVRHKFKSRRRGTSWSRMVSALALMNTREQRQVEAAYQVLRKSIALEPSCASAHALLSYVVTLRVHLAWRTRAESREEAVALAQRAIGLDPEDPWGHLALGYATLQVCNQAADAIAILHRALILDPNLSMAHYVTALASAYLGDTRSGFAHADLAERLHSRDLLARGNAGAYDIVRSTTSFVAERHREGIAFARAALRVNPRQVPAYRQVVTNGAFAGEKAQATGALIMLQRLAPDTAKFIEESAPVWVDRRAYRNYRDAFRIARLQ